jgi:carboxylesterase
MLKGVYTKGEDGGTKVKLKGIPKNTTVRKAALPLYFEGTNGKAVLLIHGFPGYPGEFRYLAERLNEAGYTVSVPRLPGHGTNGDDFEQTHWHDWLRKAIDSLMDLRVTHEEVIVGGLSMGGLIAVILAARFQIKRLILAAPALVITNKLLKFTPFFKFFIRRMPHEFDKTYEDPDLQYLKREYWNWRYIGPSADLFHLHKMGRRLIAQVTAETLTIISKTDSSVPPGVRDFINQKIGSKIKDFMVLEESGHVVINDEQKEAVADKIITWLSGDRKEHEEA